MNEMLEMIDTELSMLDRGIVRTPENDAELERFANANGGVLRHTTNANGEKLRL